MVIQSIHYTFAPEDADRVAAIFRELQDLSRREPGVVSFDVARGRDKPNVFALWEVYRDDAAMESHRSRRTGLGKRSSRSNKRSPTADTCRTTTNALRSRLRRIRAIRNRYRE